MLSLLSLTYLVSLAHAIPPTFTAVPLSGGCSLFPQYNASTATAGPWLLRAAHTGPSAIEGFTDTSAAASSLPNGPAGGSITFPARNDIAKTAIRCANDSLEAFVSADAPGPAAAATAAYAWETLRVAPDPGNAELVYRVGGGPSVRPHALFVEGARQPGVFLGAEGGIVWGFRYVAGDDGGCCGPFYRVRLLGPNSADAATGRPLKEGEFKGFVMVDGS